MDSMTDDLLKAQIDAACKAPALPIGYAGSADTIAYVSQVLGAAADQFGPIRISPIIAFITLKNSDLFCAEDEAIPLFGQEMIDAIIKADEALSALDHSRRETVERRYGLVLANQIYLAAQSESMPEPDLSRRQLEKQSRLPTDCF